MPMELTASDYESLIELTSDSVLKAKFEEVSIALFWGNLVEVNEKLLKSCYRLRRLTCVNQVFSICTNEDQISCQARCHIRYENTTITY